MLSYWLEWFSYKHFSEEVQSEFTELDKVQKEDQGRLLELAETYFNFGKVIAMRDNVSK